MSNALTPSPTPVVPERFANPLKQVQALLAQPAVRRSLPMVLMVGLIAAAALAWMVLATPTQKTLFTSLPDADKAAVTASLKQAGITARIDQGTDAVTVNEDDYARARMLLAAQGLPKAAPGGYALLDQLPMGVSRAVEGERLRQARETELARSIQEINAIAEARVHLAMPENSVFVRDSAAPSASVMVKLQPGRALDDAQVASIVNLVASSVPNMKPEAVTIVDQMGALLSKSTSATSGDDQRLRVQREVEGKYREQLNQLLTPLVGAGNFTAEVQAEVNLDETQATRESYDKQGSLKAEQTNWTGPQAAQTTPGGIPGALSNTPPPASTVVKGQGVPAPAATPTPAPSATVPSGEAYKSSDSATRAYDLGKEVSVTRSTPGTIKRLSVAVLLRDPETGKPRNAVELAQITQLVRAAVGADAGRQDQVTVISRRFAPNANAVSKQPWYEAGWVPVLARNVTALVIALLVLMLGVRPLAKALMKKREEATPEAPRIGGGRDLGSALGVAPDRVAAPGQPVSVANLAGATGFDDRIATVRGFTRDNPARAALAVRDMIKSDAR